jgi:ADP-ribose pyrophosphatase
MSESISGDGRLAPWSVESGRTVYESSPWLKVMVQEVRLPNGRLVDDYHKIVVPDFVEIFALCDDGNVVVIQQYKHGVGDVSITLPAGNIDPEESPEAAARRELLEETGYAGGSFQSLGVFPLHGNYGCGNAHIFMATGVTKTARPDSGDLEEMVVLRMPVLELKQAVLNGGVRIASTAAAIMIATDPTLKHLDTGVTFGN